MTDALRAMDLSSVIFEAVPDARFAGEGGYRQISMYDIGEKRYYGTLLVCQGTALEICSMADMQELLGMEECLIGPDPLLYPRRESGSSTPVGLWIYGPGLDCSETAFLRARQLLEAWDRKFNYD